MGIRSEIEAHRLDPNPHPNQAAGGSGPTPAPPPDVPDPSDSIPTTVNYGTPATVGSSDDYARGDHRHQLTGIGNAATRDIGSTQGFVPDAGDPRFSDARTPLAHRETHDPDGSDPMPDVENWSGFPDQTSTTLAFNSGTREFTLAPTGATFTVWRSGFPSTLTAKTVTLPNVTALYFIYLDAGNVLQYSTSPWTILEPSTLPVATVYFDAAAPAEYAPNEERHGAKRNLAWHNYSHKTIGTRYESGLAGTFTDTTLSITQGIIHDEDIVFNTGGTITNCRIWRSDGTNMRPLRQAEPYLVSGGALQYDNAGTATSVDLGKYVINDVYATTDPDRPIWIRAGTAQYGTLGDAQAALSGPVAAWLFSPAELRLLYRVIYRNLGGNPTYISATDFRSSGSLPGGGTATIPPHASTHNAGGADALAIDAAAATGSLRTLGTTATSACAGNDSRLSDARTPTAHAASHMGGSDPLSFPAGLRNRFINGCFRKWDYATSQTSSGYGSANNVSCDHSGTTKTASRQAFTVGQTDVPGEPAYYLRHVVSSVAGAGNYCKIRIPIESVRTFAGDVVTVSFYAKADASKNIALEFQQAFGTGGTPSAGVTGIGPQLKALTTAWQKFTATVSIDSISGKTLGTTDDGSLNLNIWFDAGSNFAARTASLGQQSGTFDIARVRICEGTTDCDNDPDVTPEILDIQCARYLPVFDPSTGGTGAALAPGYVYNAEGVYGYIDFKVTARKDPTGVIVSDVAHFGIMYGTETTVTCTGANFYSASNRSANIKFLKSGGSFTVGHACRVYFIDSNAKILFTGCEP